MPYKVLELFRDLPRKAGCTDCGKPGCFPFATAVCLDNYPLDECPHLDESTREVIQARLDAQRSDDAGGPCGAAIEQALVHLTGQMAGANLAILADRAGARYVAGPPESIELELFGKPHRVTREEIACIDGDAPTMWEKVFLLIYLTRATGKPPAGRWAALRELPNTASKVAEFERQAARIAEAFAGRPDELGEAAAQWTGVPVDSEAADRAFRFRALPRVDLLLLFWDGDADFPARGSMLVDRDVLEYLDQEAIVFLAESLAGRILGHDR